MLVALGDVWPGEIEIVTEHLVHGENTLEERVGLGALHVLRHWERAMASEVVGGGGQGRIERQRDVRHLHMRRKVLRLHDAVVVVLVVHGELGRRRARWRLLRRGHRDFVCFVGLFEWRTGHEERLTVLKILSGRNWFSHKIRGAELTLISHIGKLPCAALYTHRDFNYDRPRFGHSHHDWPSNHDVFLRIFFACLLHIWYADPNPGRCARFPPSQRQRVRAAMHISRRKSA